MYIIGTNIMGLMSVLLLSSGHMCLHGTCVLLVSYPVESCGSLSARFSFKYVAEAFR